MHQDSHRWRIYSMIASWWRGSLRSMTVEASSRSTLWRSVSLQTTTGFDVLSPGKIKSKQICYLCWQIFWKQTLASSEGNLISWLIHRLNSSNLKDMVDLQLLDMNSMVTGTSWFLMKFVHWVSFSLVPGQFRAAYCSCILYQSKRWIEVSDVITLFLQIYSCQNWELTSEQRI